MLLLIYLCYYVVILLKELIMFRTIEITTSSDNQGHQYTGVRRSDNYGKMGFTGKHTGEGHLYQTGNSQRIAHILSGMGYHFMYRTPRGITYGKLFA